MKEVIKCHFTLEELKYISEVIDRECAFYRYIKQQNEHLNKFMEFKELQKPKDGQLIAKLLSYIKKSPPRTKEE